MSSNQTVPTLSEAASPMDDPNERFDPTSEVEDWRIARTLKEIAAAEEALAKDPESRAHQWHLMSVRNYLEKLRRQAAS